MSSQYDDVDMDWVPGTSMVPQQKSLLNVAKFGRDQTNVGYGLMNSENRFYNLLSFSSEEIPHLKANYHIDVKCIDAQAHSCRTLCFRHVLPNPEALLHAGMQLIG